MDIEKIKELMIINYPGFDDVIRKCQYISRNDIEKLISKDNIIYYNPNFVESLNEEDRVFVFLHEILHLKFSHYQKGINKDKRAWELATDAVVNDMLKKDGFKIVDGYYENEGARTNGAKNLYEKILKELKNKEEKEEPQNQKKEEKSSSFNETKNIIAIEEISIAEDETPELKGENDLTFIGNKKSDSNGVGVFNLKGSSAKFDWKRYLNEKVIAYKDWDFENLEVENGIVKASLVDVKIPVVEVLLDTSKSMTDCLLKGLLIECKGIFKNAKLKIGFFDDEFYGFKEIKTLKNIDNIEIKGRGKTDFDVAVNSFSKGQTMKVIFTDGKAPMPQNRLRAEWIVLGEEEISPPGGNVVYLNEEQIIEILTTSIEHDEKLKEIKKRKL